ncbi:MAG: LCP family protein [Nitriliruptoraceae bacterium]
MSTNVPQPWGPVIEGRARRRRRLLVLGLVLLVAVPTLLGLVGVGVGAWIGSQIPRTAVAELAADGRPMHVLVLGSDSRAGLSEQERLELTTGAVDGERADTIMVMTIDGGRVALLALPRDLWVTRCDGTTGRVNAAIAIGGVDCMVRTVHNATGIRVHHVVEVTFAGFRDVVDAVGGVELCLEEAITDRDAGIDLPAGCQELDGADALGYVRVRKIDDDFHRIARQKQFIAALAGELTSPASLLNPVRTLRVARDAGSAVTVDDQMGTWSLARIAWGLRTVARGNVPSHTVPATPRTTSDGAWVLDPVVAEAEPLFSRFRTGAILDQVTAADTDDPSLTPRDIDVAVLNGSGIAGAAGQTAERLTEDGFVVVGIDNTLLRDTSLVMYPPGRRPDAAFVAGALRIDEYDETDAVSVVTVVLGADHRGPS